jgi:hypothetical protein
MELLETMVVRYPIFRSRRTPPARAGPFCPRIAVRSPCAGSKKRHETIEVGNVLSPYVWESKKSPPVTESSNDKD